MFLNRWAQGYDGSPALFVNRDTVCFVCGNNVKFINSKDKRESVLASPGDGIGALAVNPLYSNVAFAELKINPKLFVYVYPDFSRPRATLEGETLNSIIPHKARAEGPSVARLINLSGRVGPSRAKPHEFERKIYL